MSTTEDKNPKPLEHNIRKYYDDFSDGRSDTSLEIGSLRSYKAPYCFRSECGRCRKPKMCTDAYTAFKQEWGEIFYEIKCLMYLISVVGSYFIVLFLLAFDHRIRNNINLIIALYFFDVVYFIDFIERLLLKLARRKSLVSQLSPFMEYQSSSGDLTKYDIRYTWRRRKNNYLSTILPMLIDVASIIPIELFALLYTGGVFPEASKKKPMSRNAMGKLKSVLNLYALLRLNRTLRIYRIFSFYYKKFEMIRYQLYSKEVAAIVISFFCFFLTVFHSIACCWYFLNCNPVFNDESPKCGYFNDSDTELGRILHHFYKHVNLTTTDPWDWYVGAIHWGVITIRNAGNMLISPDTIRGMVVSIYMMIFGKFVQCLIIGVFVYVMALLDLTRSIFFHEAAGVSNFMKNFDLGKPSRKFLKQCFNSMWKSGRGFSDDRVKNLLPRFLQLKIKMDIIKPMINASQILKFFSVEMVEALSLKVQYKHYFPDEFLIRPQTVGFTMFYILEGTVEVLSTESGCSPLVSFSRGSLIGEINVIIPNLQQYGVKTSAPCDILKLSWHDVMELISLERDAHRKILATIKRRLFFVSNLPKPKMDSLKVKQPRFLVFKSLKTKKMMEYGDNKDLPSDPDIIKEDPVTDEHSLQEPIVIKEMSSNSVIDARFISILTWMLHYSNKKRGWKKVKQSWALRAFRKEQRNRASIKFYRTLPKTNVPDTLYFPLIFSTETWVFHIWDSFMVLAITVYVIMYPIEMILNEEADSPNFRFTADFIALSDLCFRIFIFRDRSEMAPLIPFESHFKKELKTLSIWFDFFAVIPFHNISYINDWDYRSQLFTRINTCFKFAKVVLKLKQLQNDVRWSTTAIIILKHVLYLFLFVVWLGTLFLNARCPKYSSCRLDSQNESYFSDFYNKGRFNLEDDNAFLVILYWAVQVTWGIGFTEIKTSNQIETTLHSVGLGIGFLLVAYACADLAVILWGIVQNKASQLDNMMWLHQYLDESLVEWQLIDRVDRYLNVQWAVLRGINTEAVKIYKGFLSIAHSMYKELVVHVVSEVLFNTYFFKNMDAEVIRSFCLTAKIAVLPPDEDIILSEDYVRRMYIIRRGEVEIYYGNTTHKMGVLRSGQSFGEVNLLYGLPSQVTIRSATYVELVLIDLNSFESILQSSSMFGKVWVTMKSSPEPLAQFKQDLKRPKTRKLSRSRRVHKSKLKILRKEIHFESKHWQQPSDWHGILPHHLKRYLMLPLTLTPNGCFLRTWETVRVLFVMYNLFWVPLLEAFPEMKITYGMHVHVSDGISLFDMFVRLHVAYFEPKTNIRVIQPKLCAKHYLTTSFLTDLIGGPIIYYLMVFCFSFLSHKFRTSVYCYIFRLNRLLLVYRIFSWYKFSKPNIISRHRLWKVAKFAPLFFINAHILACLLSVITCPAIDLPYDSLRCKANTWISLSKTYGDPRNETLGRSAIDLTDWQVYVFAFYFIATTSVGCGFGDFMPANGFERALFATLFIFYIFGQALALAVAVGTKCHLDFKVLRYQRQMVYLVRYLRKERMDPVLASQIIKYYDHQWLRTQGIEPNKLFAYLFPSLRKEVALNVFEDVLRQIPLLKRVENSFLRAICVYLTPLYFIRQDIIVRSLDLCDTIFFIFRGKVAISTSDNYTRIMQEGGYLGNMEPTAISVTYGVTATAISNVDVFSIKKKDLNQVLRCYPRVAERFQDTKEPLSYHDTSYRAAQLTEYMERKETNQRNLQEVLSTLPKPTDSFDDQDSLEKRNYDKDPDVGSTLSGIMGMAIEDDATDHVVDDTRLYQQFILPESAMMKFLEIIVAVSAMISSCLAIYQASFLDSRMILFAIGYCCDAVYVIKMILTFRMSYFDDTGEVILDFSEIENTYLSRFQGFLFDFLSTIPLELMTIGGFRRFGIYNTWVFCRLNRFIRLLHVWNFFRKGTDKLLVKLMRVKLARAVTLSLIYIHLAACLIQVHSFFLDPSDKCADIGYDEKSACMKPLTWSLTKGKLGQQSYLSSSYTVCVYFILSAFTTTSYGDFTPVSLLEMIFISMIAVSSKIWIGLTLSDVLSAAQNDWEITYHPAADGVLRLYKDLGVKRDVLSRSSAYFRYAWVANNGVIIPDFVRKAPECIKMDILTSIYGDHFRNSKLFRELSEGFIRQLCLRLHHMHVMTKDMIVQEGEIDNKLYVVHKGIVTYFKTGDNHENIAGFISPCHCFGQIQGITGPWPHSLSYQAVTDADVISIKHEDLEVLFDSFPNHKAEIMSRMEKMYPNHDFTVPRSPASELMKYAAFQ